MPTFFSPPPPTPKINSPRPRAEVSWSQKSHQRNRCKWSQEVVREGGPTEGWEACEVRPTTAHPTPNSSVPWHEGRAEKWLIAPQRSAHREWERPIIWGEHRLRARSRGNCALLSLGNISCRPHNSKDCLSLNVYLVSATTCTPSLGQLLCFVMVFFQFTKEKTEARLQSLWCGGRIGVLNPV